MFEFRLEVPWCGKAEADLLIVDVESKMSYMSPKPVVLSDDAPPLLLRVGTAVMSSGTTQVRRHRG